MKIIMLYSPRSKSTWTHDVLVKRFDLDPSWCEPLLESRRPRQDYQEYPEIIDRINRAENCCIKISCNDWIDIKNKRLRYDFKTIDWNRFDHVITHTRDDCVNAILSYAYMDMRDRTTEHRRRGEVKHERLYHTDINIMYYLLRGYAMFDQIKKHIVDHVDPDKIHHYEFSTVHQEISAEFALTDNDLITDTVSNDLDYSKLAINYHEILSEAPKILHRLKQQITDPTETFWQYRDTIL